MNLLEAYSGFIQLCRGPQHTFFLRVSVATLVIVETQVHGEIRTSNQISEMQRFLPLLRLELPLRRFLIRVTRCKVLMSKPNESGMLFEIAWDTSLIEFLQNLIWKLVLKQQQVPLDAFAKTSLSQYIIIFVFPPFRFPQKELHVENRIQQNNPHELFASDVRELRLVTTPYDLLLLFNEGLEVL
ncbi:hypothetical protein S245_039887 [Arachis hypogaea]|nr:uncharacterized protein DS421_12g364050 [Arachis hypogaea]